MSGSIEREKRDRKVNASCMDFLTLEIVNYVSTSCGHLSDEAVFYKLEKLGFDIGQRLIERYSANLQSKERRRFQDHLEIIKFLAKEFWVETFSKQADNLRTNHRVC